jgi:hypothetical protein
MVFVRMLTYMTAPRPSSRPCAGIHSAVARAVEKWTPAQEAGVTNEDVTRYRES